MAEGKGANIARLMTKQAGRAKEKVNNKFYYKGELILIIYIVSVSELEKV